MNGLGNFTEAVVKFATPIRLANDLAFTGDGNAVFPSAYVAGEFIGSSLSFVSATTSGIATFRTYAEALKLGPPQFAYFQQESPSAVGADGYAWYGATFGSGSQKQTSAVLRSRGVDVTAFIVPDRAGKEDVVRYITAARDGNLWFAAYQTYAVHGQTMAIGKLSLSGTFTLYEVAAPLGFELLPGAIVDGLDGATYTFVRGVDLATFSQAVPYIVRTSYNGSSTLIPVPGDPFAGSGIGVLGGDGNIYWPIDGNQLVELIY